MHEEAIRLTGITKTFGSVVANRNVNLEVCRGEILALLGENGSGKTTLMNMLSGIYRPDSGSIEINGQPVVIQTPEDSKRLGIGMIHQHFKLVEVMSAADNILLGSQKERRLLSASRFEKVRSFCAEIGMEVDPKKKIYDMAVSEKQTVEIIKVLYQGADILILDEPTAVLTPQETERLFAILRKMREKGAAIILITHKLNEVMSVSDRVAILRKGESVATVETAKTSIKELTELMVGRSVSLAIDRPERTVSNELLNIHHLSVCDEHGVERLKDVSFDLSAGEVLGVAGVAGSGQKELCEAVAGLRPIHKGAILFKKENIEGKSPREIIKLGIGMSFIPEDRLGMGLAASLSITDNMILKNYHKGKSPFINRRKASLKAQSIVERYQVATPSTSTAVRKLSGGNVQKVLLGREIDAAPSVLITAYAVRGLDIHSSYMIYDEINKQKQNGVGVLFVGEDLDVMLEFCDRILVLCHGEVTGVVNAKETSKEQLGLLMTGSVEEAGI